MENEFGGAWTRDQNYIGSRQQSSRAPKKCIFFSYIFEILNKCSFKIANVSTPFSVVLAEIGDSPAKRCRIFSLR